MDVLHQWINVFLQDKKQCWGLFGFAPYSIIFHSWRRHHYRWRTANFGLCSALMATEQWWFFSVLNLLWHGAYVYNCHLWGPVTHTYCRAFGNGAVTTTFNDLGLSRLGFGQLTFRLRGEHSNRHGSKMKKLQHQHLESTLLTSTTLVREQLWTKGLQFK